MQVDGAQVRRWLVTMIGSVTGVCFAALAARSISVLAITPNFFRLSSVVFAVITACLSYVAFRTSTSGRTDQHSFARALLAGVGGALLGVLVVILAHAMFRQAARAYFAHPLGLRFAQVTTLRLLIAFLCLGFGAGFVLRMQTLRQGKAQ